MHVVVRQTMALAICLSATTFAAGRELTKIAQLATARGYANAQKFDRAVEAYNEIIGTKQVKGKVPKEHQGWAHDILDIRIEKAELMEARAVCNPSSITWSAAVQEWVGISNTFARALKPLGGEGRALFFEVYFAQKRCTVFAYQSMGTESVRGENAEEKLKHVQEKFARLAKELHDIQSVARNPDFPKALKADIKNLVSLVEPLKTEYEKIGK